MFLQSKYEKQLQQDTRTTFGATGFQQAKKEFKARPAVIGSVRLARTNFERGEQIFPKEDIPKQKLESKNQMNQLVDPDILGLRKKEWNSSAAVPWNTQEEDFERKLTKIKLGFFDTPLPKYRPNIIEAGTDTRNDYTNWNVSTEAASRFENQQRINNLTQYALSKTQGHFNKISDYKTPTETIKNFNETIRQTKREEKDLRDELKKKYKFENPSATEERTNAGVNRLVYEHKKNTIRPQSEDPMNNQTFKPDLSKTLKPAVSHYAYHNGSWGVAPLSPEKEVWSCCMTEKKTGEGCVKVKVNKDKWIYDSCGACY